MSSLESVLEYIKSVKDFGDLRVKVSQEMYDAAFVILEHRGTIRNVVEYFRDSLGIQISYSTGKKIRKKFLSLKNTDNSNKRKIKQSSASYLPEESTRTQIEETRTQANLVKDTEEEIITIQSEKFKPVPCLWKFDDEQENKLLDELEEDVNQGKIESIFKIKTSVWKKYTARYIDNEELRYHVLNTDRVKDVPKELSTQFYMLTILQERKYLHLKKIDI